MIPLDNPKKYLTEFFQLLKSNTNYTKSIFQSYYYRALLVNPKVRHLRNLYIKEDYKKIEELTKEILKEDYTDEKKLENNFNTTLFNITQFHLDNYIGKSNEEKNLKEIELELLKLFNSIFLKDIPFNLKIEDTTKDYDPSKTKGSKFRVKITPKLYLNNQK